MDEVADRRTKENFQFLEIRSFGNRRVMLTFLAVLSFPERLTFARERRGRHAARTAVRTRIGDARILLLSDERHSLRHCGSRGQVGDNFRVDQ